MTKEDVLGKIWAGFGSGAHGAMPSLDAVAAGNEWLYNPHPTWTEWCKGYEIRYDGEHATRMDILASQPGWAEFGEDFVQMAIWAGVWAADRMEDPPNIDIELLKASVAAAVEESGTFLCDPDGKGI